jgi:hypothetical protein
MRVWSLMLLIAFLKKCATICICISFQKIWLSLQRTHIFAYQFKERTFAYQFKEHTFLHIISKNAHFCISIQRTHICMSIQRICICLSIPMQNYTHVSHLDTVSLRISISRPLALTFASTFAYQFKAELHVFR